AADTAGVQVNRCSAGGRGLGDLVQAQRLPPLPEQAPPARGGSKDPAGQCPARSGQGPRDHRDVRVPGQDGSQLGGCPLLPAGPVALADPAAGHQVTSRPVNQPAFSSAARASSAVRCPYVAEVVVTDEWPRSLETTSTDTPSRSHLVAAECLNQCGSNTIPVLARSRRTRS